MAIQAPETRHGERRVVVRFHDDEIADCRTADLDLDRPQFVLHIDSWSDNSRAAIARQPQSRRNAGRARSALPRHEAPLIDLLGEIRGLRGLCHRGEISAVEYERRRSQVLNRI